MLISPLRIALPGNCPSRASPDEIARAPGPHQKHLRKRYCLGVPPADQARVLIPPGLSFLLNTFIHPMGKSGLVSLSGTKTVPEWHLSQSPQRQTKIIGRSRLGRYQREKSPVNCPALVSGSINSRFSPITSVASSYTFQYTPPRHSQSQPSV